MFRYFDFECSECGGIYEALVNNDEQPKCKECGSSEYQKKILGFAHGYATQDDYPRTQRDLDNYFGNGEYRPGYKMDSWKRKK